jgi:hypothetical protein
MIRYSSPIASPPRMALIRLMRQATSPTGSKVNSLPSHVYSGYPGGCARPRIAGIVASSFPSGLTKDKLGVSVARYASQEISERPPAMPRSNLVGRVDKPNTAFISLHHGA